MTTPDITSITDRRSDPGLAFSSPQLTPASVDRSLDLSVAWLARTVSRIPYSTCMPNPLSQGMFMPAQRHPHRSTCVHIRNGTLFVACDFALRVAIHTHDLRGRCLQVSMHQTCSDPKVLQPRLHPSRPRRRRRVCTSPRNAQVRRAHARPPRPRGLALPHQRGRRRRLYVLHLRGREAPDFVRPMRGGLLGEHGHARASSAAGCQGVGGGGGGGRRPTAGYRQAAFTLFGLLFSPLPGVLPMFSRIRTVPHKNRPSGIYD